MALFAAGERANESHRAVKIHGARLQQLRVVKITTLYVTDVGRRKERERDRKRKRQRKREKGIEKERERNRKRKKENETGKERDRE